MSETYDKGKAFEQLVSKLIRKKIDKKSMRNKGSHANWNRRSDVYTELPLHVECKHHEKIKIREWYDQAQSAANALETAVVVFKDEDRVMCVLEFDDLLNYMVEIADLKAEVEDLQKPVDTVDIYDQAVKKAANEGKAYSISGALEKQVEQKIDRGAKSCPAGHLLAPGSNKCSWKGCKFASGYKPKKKSK